MSATRIELTLYRSALCPRCHLSDLALRRILRDRPGFALTRVELLTNRSRARRDGVRSIPTLVTAGRTLTGVLLTPGRIERFLDSLESGPERAPAD
jgi:hypothetical protein